MVGENQNRYPNPRIKQIWTKIQSDLKSSWNLMYENFFSSGIMNDELWIIS